MGTVTRQLFSDEIVRQCDTIGGLKEEKEEEKSRNQTRDQYNSQTE